MHNALAKQSHSQTSLARPGIWASSNVVLLPRCQQFRVSVVWMTPGYADRLIGGHHPLIKQFGNDMPHFVLQDVRGDGIDGM